MFGRPVISLRWKLVLMSLAIGAVAQFLAGVVLTIHAGDSFRGEKAREISAAAAMLASAVTASLDFGDAKAASGYLAAFSADPDLEAAGVYGADGAPFAGFTQRQGARAQLPDRAPPPGSSFAGSHLEISYPVTEGGRTLGSVYLRRSVEPAGARLLRYSLLVLAALAGSLLISIPIALRLTRAVSGPIMEIATASYHIAEGDLAARISPSDRQDEIGMLQRSFRRMVESLREMTANLERRVAERTAQLEAARAEADNANRAKANFLAAMSHEIRTPMNGVIGMIDVLHQSSLKGYQVEMVDLIRESALSLLTIIDDILDFSKIEADRIDLEYGPVSLAGEVEKAIGLMDRLAGKMEVELTFFVDPALPAEVMGDGLRLRQILVNLTNNAVKFSSGQGRKGKVSVRAELIGRQDDRAEVAFHVRDNGIGMDEETRRKLFTPFTQADASTTRRFGGTGLGLAISLNLAERMGGKIEVRSAPGEGACFTVRIPFTLSETADLGPSPSSVEGLSCVVIGGEGSLAPDFAAYLAAAGASVKRYGALEEATGGSGDPRVWIFDDPGGAKPDQAVLHSIAGLEDGVVVVGRGTRRHPRRERDGVVGIDGDALSRSVLLWAVAIAAGREEEAVEVTQHGRQESAFRLVSREEALRRGRLILVAEDNETNRKVIQRQFSLLGIAADIVENGAQALDRWENCPYALLLTDLHMPEMDGYQLASAIRAREINGRHMPIVALTANAQRNEIYRCRAVGIDDHLIKPAQLVELEAMIEKWLPPEPAAPPFDLSVLAALIGDDPDTLREFLADYRKSTAEIAADLRAAYRRNDLTACAEAAHKLASSSRAMGAVTLSDLCRQLEESGKERQAGAVDALMPLFDAEIEAMERYLAPPRPGE